MAHALFDEHGQRRSDFGLTDLFGCSTTGEVETRLQNSYLTLRHPTPLARGLEGTNRVIGPLARVLVEAADQAEVALTWVPSYTDLPMERVFTTTPITDIPMAICRRRGLGRVVYFPMDLDRTFSEVMAADHLALLTNAVRWAAPDGPPLEVSGPGVVDVAVWRQAASLTVHLVNLNNPMALRGAVHDLVAAGPYTVRLRIPAGLAVEGVHLLEAGTDPVTSREGDWLVLTIPSVLLHEVVAVDVSETGRSLTDQADD